MVKHLLLLLFSCLLSHAATAGWVVTYKDAEAGSYTQEFYDKGKASFGELIVTDNQFLVIDHESQSYWQGTAQQYCAALREQRQKIDQQLASLPAQYKPVPITQKKVTQQEIGAQSIAGFTATGYDFYVDGSQQGQVWVSTDKGLADIIRFEKSQSKKMKCFDELNDMSLEGEHLTPISRAYPGAFAEYIAIPRCGVERGFVLKEPHRQVVWVEKKAVPASHFSPPTGYQSFSNYQQYVDFVGGRFNDSADSAMSPSEVAASRTRRDTHAEAQDQDEEEDNIIVNDAKDIGRGAVDEVHDSTKEGIEEEVHKDIKKGVNKMLRKWF